MRLAAFYQIRRPPMCDVIYSAAQFGVSVDGYMDRCAYKTSAPGHLSCPLSAQACEAEGLSSIK